MTSYVYRPGDPQANGMGMVRKRQAPPRRPVFHYWSDIPPYMSPLGTGEVTSRSHRREELARHNCREVEPSEFGRNRW